MPLPKVWYGPNDWSGISVLKGVASPGVRPPLDASDLEEVSARLQGMAELLRGARVLIPGGSGFVGAWLLETALHLDSKFHLGLRLVVLTRNPQAFRHRSPHLALDPRLEVYAHDMGSGPPPKELGAITHLIHAASDVSLKLDPQQALAALRVLDRGTEDLLQAAEGWPLKRMLYLSSPAVYDPWVSKDAWQSDVADAPPTPNLNLTYATGKRVAELRMVLHAQHTGQVAVIARLCALLGPLMPLQGGFAAGNFIRDTLRRKPIQILSDGSPVRTYQYTVDLAVWLWTLLLVGDSCATYNVGGDTPISLKDFANKVDGLGSRSGVEILGRAEPGRGPDVLAPPVGKAAFLGLRNEVTLDEAIQRTLDWHARHPYLL